MKIQICKLQTFALLLISLPVFAQTTKKVEDYREWEITCATNFNMVKIEPNTDRGNHLLVSRYHIDAMGNWVSNAKPEDSTFDVLFQHGEKSLYLFDDQSDRKYYLSVPKGELDHGTAELEVSSFLNQEQIKSEALLTAVTCELILRR